MQPLAMLIVGGGATGALLGSLLPSVQRANLWEKSQSAGRMSSSVSRGEASPSMTDTGAQYFTALDSASSEALLSLNAQGVLSRLPKGSIVGEREPYASLASYCAPAGSASIVSHYLSEAGKNGLVVEKGRRLASLEICGDSWLCVDESGGKTLARCVALTLPAPQLLELKGETYREVLTKCGAIDALRGVSFSSRFCLSLHFPKAFAEVFWSRLPPTACGRFIGTKDAGGNVLRYLSFETRKRLAHLPHSDLSGVFPSFVAHSSVEFGGAHEDKNSPAVEKELRLAALEAVAAWAGFSSPAELPPILESRVHRWKYSQVTSGVGGGWVRDFVCTTAPLASSPAAFLLQGVPTAAGPSPPLIIAGDYCTGVSNFAACLRSATEAKNLAMKIT